MKKSAIFAVVACAALGGGAIPVSRVLAQAFDEFSPAKLAALRAEGPRGLETLVAAHAAELKLQTPNPPQNDAGWMRLCAALDEVGGQKDNYAARLYWFTDLEKAKAASQAQNKPILSLRLLGKLTDELSCANSRFFRTALYPNAQISRELREKFVLHWSSERPVPVVTIDFGDGRKIKRTLTGNSAHYLLDYQGQPLDVLPGLYGPGAFQKWLEGSEKLFADYAAKPEVERSAFLAEYHRAALETTWREAYVGVSRGLGELQLKNLMENASKNNPLTTQQRGPFAVPTALVAGERAYGKRIAEFSLLSSTLLPGQNPPRADWSLSPITARNQENAKLDAAARNFLRAKNPIFEQNLAGMGSPAQYINVRVRLQNTNGQRTVDPFETLVAGFENALAIDTARNELEFHVPIRAAFAEGKQGDFEELNRKIYDRLFLTSQNDPWLGLSSEGTYTALQNGGIQTPNPQPQKPIS